MRTFKTLALAGGACLAALVFGQMSGQTPQPTAPAAGARVGSPAPPFTVSDTSGRQVDLAKLRGRFVVLEWFNPECPFVKKHYVQGHMQKLQREMSAEGVTWIVVNSGAPGQQGHMSLDETKAKAESWKLAAAHIVIDADGTIGRKYGAKRTPEVFLIDPKGILVYSGAIDSDGSPDTSAIAKAENYLVRAFEEARAGKPVTKPQTPAYGCSVKYAPAR